MFTVRIAKEKIATFISDLRAGGFAPTRVVLFGSVAKGNSHRHSDIDVAIWDKKFTGCTAVDYELFASIKRKHPRIEVHTYQAGETSADNPFISEIEKEGIEIAL
ncbi:MAG: nucleotidyltransferase domain-containing protein [Bacteroidetes bacterium]|nr:nucleotidyltransferase domain-containing protein [Bacteroidota bacterium]MBS1540329.1 nucleotidyltransferase domain-containing protein [Bacteroidota bacterium]